MASDTATRDRDRMARCMQLARRGLGRVEPNPVVGALVVHNDAVVGRGWHARYGGPHAEVHALERAGRAACEATLYVTLAPCTRHGKTPPCTEAIIKAGVSRVVIGAPDPTQSGPATLEANGVAVVRGVLADACRAQNPYFFRLPTGERPFVMAKWAMSSDGHISPPAGRSRWISCEDSRELTHHWRGAVDGIAVGIGTVLADDPRLTCRVGLDHPTRIVFDPSARTPLDSRLVLTVDQAPLIIVTADNAPSDRIHALRGAGCAILTVPRAPVGVDIPHALARLLAEHDIRTLMIEGGSRVMATFFEQRLVDEMRIFVAPVLFGDGIECSAPPWTMAALARAMNAGNTIQHAVGADLLLVSRLTDPTDAQPS